MKRSMITLALAVCAVSGWAHAAGTVNAAGDATSVVQTKNWSASPNGIAPKTRSQIRQELVEAKRDGQLAYLNSTLYRGGM
ncbi:DUF4148 domain-containing protein [Caballeronia sordidicola]|jgi:hypothetical protein|uniref:DUF4148 domain-containing protein n=1 Tax=Caballeronia sordidicola TaxID=196367 RepID=UPI000B7941D9|nr:DUF4148 domain-containing protein [Caballeronia sordidicola]